MVWDRDSPWYIGIGTVHGMGQGQSMALDRDGAWYGTGIVHGILGQG